MNAKLQKEIEMQKVWLQNPDAFAEYLILGLTKEQVRENKVGARLEPESREMLLAVRDNDYVSIHSGRGVTKTFTLAILVLWWVFTRCDSRVMCTGPKFDQLKSTLWAEVRKWLNKSRAFADQLEWTAETIYHKDPSMNAFGKIMTAKDKENLAGVHDQHVLWLIDEASNVDETIIDTIIGGMNDPECKIVMAGNPTRTSGAHYASYTRDAQKWKVLHYSSEDAARVNPAWIERMRRFPRDHDSYRVWVLGLPPKGNPEAVIPLEDCIAAREREVNTEPYLEMGVDPAWQGGDFLTVGVRWGMRLCEIKYYTKSETSFEYRTVIDTVRKWRQTTGIESTIRIKVDAGGGYGKGLIEALSLNEEDNIECIPVHFGGKGNEEYRDYGTVMWYHLKEIIGKIQLPNDDALIEELSDRQWEPVDLSRIKIESKRKFKDRLGRSPDRADCCVLCFAPGPKIVFSKHGKETSADFKVDWARQHSAHDDFQGCRIGDCLNYVGIVLMPDLSIAGLAAMYDYNADKLWIYGGYSQSMPMAESLVYQVKATAYKDVHNKEQVVRVIGNDRMFKSDGDRRPFAEIVRRAGLYIRETFHYDEFGAIALGVGMFSKGKIVMHDTLEDVRQQVGLWVVKDGKISIDDKGYCKALLLILSEVKRERKSLTRPLQQRRSPYSGRIGDYRNVLVDVEKKSNKYSWIR